MAQNLTNQIDFDSVAISGPASSTTSIGVDLTGVQGNQIVDMVQQRRSG